MEFKKQTLFDGITAKEYDVWSIYCTTNEGTAQALFIRHCYLIQNANYSLLFRLIVSSNHEGISDWADYYGRLVRRNDLVNVWKFLKDKRPWLPLKMEGKQKMENGQTILEHLRTIK